MKEDWTERLTAEERTLKALADAATEGPWELGRHTHWGRGDERFRCWNLKAGIVGIAHADAERQNGDADAAFIAAAREAVPALISTVASLRALVEEYRAKLEARRTYYMASPYADNTIEIATLGWALAELNALKESDMQAKE